MCFDGVAPNLQRALQEFKDERQLWLAAGAKGLAVLVEGQVSLDFQFVIVLFF